MKGKNNWSYRPICSVLLLMMDVFLWVIDDLMRWFLLVSCEFACGEFMNACEVNEGCFASFGGGRAHNIGSTLTPVSDTGARSTQPRTCVQEHARRTEPAPPWLLVWFSGGRAQNILASHAPSHASGYRLLVPYSEVP